MLNKKNLGLFLCIMLLTQAVPQIVGAMHIMEGFLPPVYCVVWGALCIPPLFLGVGKINKMIKDNSQIIILLAMAGAFSFVLSALKIPSVTGSSSHMTGLGFSAIMFGPFVSSILGTIVLLFQALLLAHGGLTTLGANAFSMGVIGPLVAYVIYASLNSAKASKKASIFFAAALGDLATYIVTSVQLALAYPGSTGGFMESFAKFGSIFAFTQVPLAIIEGILTVVLINVISAYGKDMFQTVGKGVFVYE